MERGFPVTAKQQRLKRVSLRACTVSMPSPEVSRRGTCSPQLTYRPPDVPLDLLKLRNEQNITVRLYFLANASQANAEAHSKMEEYLSRLLYALLSYMDPVACAAQVQNYLQLLCNSFSWAVEEKITCNYRLLLLLVVSRFLAICCRLSNWLSFIRLLLNHTRSTTLSTTTETCLVSSGRPNLILSCFSREPSGLNNTVKMEKPAKKASFWANGRNYQRLTLPVLYFLPLQYGDIIRLFPVKR